MDGLKGLITEDGADRYDEFLDPRGWSDGQHATTTSLFHSIQQKPDLNAILHSFITEPKSLLYVSFIPSVLLPHPLSLIFYTTNSLSSIADRKCEMNLMLCSASPKGSWDFYCKDLIDWRRRGDSPSRSTLSSALAFCVSFSFFHPPSENHKKVVLHLRDSSFAVKQLKKNVFHDLSLNAKSSKSTSVQQQWSPFPFILPPHGCRPRR